MWQKLKRHIADWWRGKYIPPPPNDPNSYFAIFSAGRHEKPLLAKAWEWLASHFPSDQGWWVKLIFGGVVAVAVSVILKKL